MQNIYCLHQFKLVSAWICRLLHLFSLLNILCLSGCVLPIYTPALIQGGIDREDLIRGYFVQGFTNAAIVGFLILQDGIICSVRTVKQILRRLRLKRAGQNNELPIERGRIGELVFLIYGISVPDKAIKTEI